MKWTDLILYIVCFVTICFAVYDLTTLNSTVNDKIEQCNAHWEQQFKDKCNAFEGPKFISPIDLEINGTFI